MDNSFINQMFYKTVASPGGDAAKSVIFSDTGANDSEVTRTGPDAQGFFTFEFDMSSTPLWTDSTITELRLDFTRDTVGSITEVDLIKIEERLVGA